MHRVAMINAQTNGQNVAEAGYIAACAHFSGSTSKRIKRFGKAGGLGWENRVGGLYRASWDGNSSEGGLGGISVIAGLNFAPSCRQERAYPENYAGSSSTNDPRLADHHLANAAGGS